MIPDKTQGVPEGPEGGRGKNREKGGKVVQGGPRGFPEGEKDLMEVEGKRKERNRWVEWKRESPGRQQA